MLLMRGCKLVYDKSDEWYTSFNPNGPGLIRRTMGTSQGARVSNDEGFGSRIAQAFPIV